MDPSWLDWAKRLQAIGQNGLTYNDNGFDVERYEAVRQVAAEIMAAGFGRPVEAIRGLFETQSGYATPKVDVRAVVIRDNRLLLVKETEDGRWTLPGGWADVCETPGTAVAREVREEAGYDVQVKKLLAVLDRSKHPHAPPFPFHVYKMFFRCEIVGDRQVRALGGETAGADWFAEDALPELSVSRVTAGQVARVFEHHRHPDWPTDFD